MKTTKKNLILKSFILIFLAFGALMANAETLSVRLAGKAQLLQFGEDETLNRLLDLDDVPNEIRDALLDIKTYCYRAPLRDTDSGLRVGTGFHCVAEIIHNCPPVISDLQPRNVLDTSDFDLKMDMDAEIVRDCPKCIL